MGREEAGRNGCNFELVLQEMAEGARYPRQRKRKRQPIDFTSKKRAVEAGPNYRKLCKRVLCNEFRNVPKRQIDSFMRANNFLRPFAEGDTAGVVKAAGQWLGHDENEA